MSVGRICVREVDLAEPGDTVQAAASRMHAHKVGTLIVLDQDKRPIGIVTDRDLCVRVLGQAKEPVTTTVGEVMSRCPHTVKEDTPIEQALGLMRSGPFRRIPVVDDNGKLVGLLSVDDILDLLVEEFKDLGDLLRRESPESLADS